MAFDIVTGRAVLFGGEAGDVDGAGAPANDTWLWNRSNWSEAKPPLSPPARRDHAMAYDEARGEVVLFGGIRTGDTVLVDTILSDTWVWNGTTWALKSPAVSPPALYRHAIAYDPLRRVVVLSGGRGQFGLDSNETWIWNGANWHRAQANSPGARTSDEMARDAGQDNRIRQAAQACPASGALPADPFNLANDCAVTYTYTAKAGDKLAVRAIGRGSTYGPRDYYFSSFVDIAVTGPAPANTAVASGSYRQPWDPVTYLPDSGVLSLPSAGTYNIVITPSGGPAGAAYISSVRSGQPCIPEFSPYGIYGGTSGASATASFTGPWFGVQGFDGYNPYRSNVSVALPPGCTAAVSSNVPWSAPSHAFLQSGYTTLSVSMEANYGPERTGTLMVGGVALSIRQEATGCSFALHSPGTSISGSRWTGSVQLTAAGSYCPWTATSNASWLQPYPLSGFGSATIQYTVFPNFGTRQRTAGIQIAGRTFSVIQAPSPGSLMQRFVRLLYFSSFGRVPSDAEVAIHSDSGQSREQLALNFFNSDEFNLGARYVAGLYVGLLNRDAEYGGWLFQRDALATGSVVQNGLVSNFLNSTEFVTKYGPLDNRAFVALLYKQILLRVPSPAEVDFQSGALASGVSRADLTTSFLNSGEFRKGTGPRLTAFLLYATLLQRQPTAPEFQTAATVAAQVQSISDLVRRNGLIRDQLLAPVINSAEMEEILR